MPDNSVNAGGFAGRGGTVQDETVSELFNGSSNDEKTSALAVLGTRRSCAVA